MKQQKINFKPDELLEKLKSTFIRVRRYSVMVFLAFVIIVYALVLFQIHNLNAVEPSSDAVSSQVQAARLPHIDQSVVQQLQTLQDNSVNVQALFDQERNNPFQ